MKLNYRVLEFQILFYWTIIVKFPLYLPIFEVGRLKYLISTFQFFKFSFTPRKAEKKLQGKEFQEKELKKFTAFRKSLYKKPTVNRRLLILDLKLFTLYVKG